MDNSERESQFSHDLEKVDRRIRIDRLKQEVEEISGHEMLAWSSDDDADSELAEEFWEHVVAFEKAPRRTLFAQLHEAGVALPPPDSLLDTDLHAKLWEVINKLAELRVFLYHTDHLSDRDLYDQLWDDLLREENVIMPPNADSAFHLDILGCCSEEDIQIGLKYYDGPEERAHWHECFPEDPIPDHEDPPYDRDRYLPKREFPWRGQGGEGEWEETS